MEEKRMHTSAVMEGDVHLSMPAVDATLAKDDRHPGHPVLSREIFGDLIKGSHGACTMEGELE